MKCNNEKIEPVHLSLSIVILWYSFANLAALKQKEGPMAVFLKPWSILSLLSCTVCLFHVFDQIHFNISCMFLQPKNLVFHLALKILPSRWKVALFGRLLYIMEKSVLVLEIKVSMICFLLTWVTLILTVLSDYWSLVLVKSCVSKYIFISYFDLSSASCPLLVHFCYFKLITWLCGK